MTDPDSTHGERRDVHVGARVIKGAAFMTGGRFVLRLFSLLNLVVLGRLLDPADVGVAAIAITTITLFQLVSDVRVNSAIVAMERVDGSHLDTGLTLGLVRGVLIAAALVAFAGPIADYANEPRLADVLRVLAIVPLLDGLRNPAFILFQRNIDFSREFWRQAIATALGSAAVIAGAFVLRSYWAIVIGTLVGRFVEMALTYWRVPARLRLSLDGWRGFVRFGGWLTLTGILGFLRVAVPTFLLGRFVGSAGLGLFTIARDLSMLSTRELATPLSSAIFPGLATIAADPERLRRAYVEAQTTVLAVALPLGLGTALLAQDFIQLLVGAKWLAAAPLVQLLAPVVALSMLSAAAGGLAMAKSQTRLLFWRSLVVAVIALPAIWAGVAFHGLIGAVYGVAFAYLVEIVVTLHTVARLTGSRIWTPIVESRRSLVAGAAMVAALVTLPAAAPGTSEVALMLSLAPKVALGAAVYTLVHYALWRLERRPSGVEARMIGLMGGLVRRSTRRG